RNLRGAGPTVVPPWGKVGNGIPAVYMVAMHRSRLSTFVIDCRGEDVDGAARFWSAALGRKLEPPDPNEPKYRQLAGTEQEPILLVQSVDHESRIHLDIEADDIEAEVKRLEALG